ncbi:MAG: glycerophosphodiester phosphodiesterase [Actinomycetota bacterium]|nr:glycerophosphodiester phosphodiesterase [Actinomycetota bacterium]
MNVSVGQDADRSPRVIAHRGASAEQPENTMPAFAAARAAGADGVELDVRLSADDVLVLHHDAHLADGRLIRAVHSTELPPSIPTLGEVMLATADLFVNIEIKNSPSEEGHDPDQGLSVAVAALVAGMEAHDRTLVSSFELESILRLRPVDPTIALAWLTWGEADPEALIGRAVDHRLQAINPHDRQVDRAFVERAQGEGLAVYVWTVDSPERALELADFGVDGIITNDPRALVRALARWSEPRS